jgi:hypothetical protein
MLVRVRDIDITVPGTHHHPHIPICLSGGTLSG